jgi:hypothetical protein
MAESECVLRSAAHCCAPDLGIIPWILGESPGESPVEAAAFPTVFHTPTNGLVARPKRVLTCDRVGARDRV